MKIAILGRGAFGSAMSSHLSRLGHDVLMDKISDSEIIFVCVPSHAVTNALLKLKEEISDQRIVICSKGFAENGLLVSEALKEQFENEIFFLYGPTLADELGREIFSGMVLAGSSSKNDIKKEIESENLHIDLSDDVVGVEIGATLKNIMAIFIGIVEGAKYGQNTNAFIFTKSAQEIKKIGVALGGRPDTFLGLSCIGDLYLPSRNRKLGVLLGEGRNIEDIIAETNYTPAGIFALKDAQGLIQKLNIEAPIIRLLFKIVFENYPIKNAVKEVMDMQTDQYT